MPPRDVDKALANFGDKIKSDPKGPVLQRIQNAMHGYDRPMRTVEIANDLDLPIRQVRDALIRLVEKGLVVRTQIRVPMSGINIYGATLPASVYEILPD